MFKLFDQFHFLEYVVGVVDNLVYGSTRLPILEYNNILLQNLYVMVENEHSCNSLLCHMMDDCLGKA